MTKQAVDIKASWLTLEAVEAAIPAMQHYGVSAVARGAQPSQATTEGFIEAYRKAKGDPGKLEHMQARPGESWAQRRNNFVKRHMGQARTGGETLVSKGIPSRRLLGLIAWAYVPPAETKAIKAWYDAGCPVVPKKRRNSIAALPKWRRDLILSRAHETLNPHVSDWVFQGRKEAKQRLFAAYETLTQEQKEALTEEIKGYMPATLRVYRSMRPDRSLTEIGGYSVTDSAGTRSGNAVHAWEITPNDVMLHYKQAESWLSSKTYAHEREIILKADANPRHLGPLTRSNGAFLPPLRRIPRPQYDPGYGPWHPSTDFVPMGYLYDLGRGRKHNQEKPVDFDLTLMPEGTWFIANHSGLYGRAIEELVWVNTEDVYPSELEDGQLAPNKQAYLNTYVNWLKDGYQPPPAHLIETREGALRLTDGHRRYMAAKALGVPLLAVVSYAVPNGWVTPQGVRDVTGLTREIARQDADLLGFMPDDMARKVRESEKDGYPELRERRERLMALKARSNG